MREQAGGAYIEGLRRRWNLPNIYVGVYPVCLLDPPRVIIRILKPGSEERHKQADICVSSEGYFPTAKATLFSLNFPVKKQPRPMPNSLKDVAPGAALSEFPAVGCVKPVRSKVAHKTVPIKRMKGGRPFALPPGTAMRGALSGDDADATWRRRRDRPEPGGNRAARSPSVLERRGARGEVRAARVKPRQAASLRTESCCL